MCLSLIVTTAEERVMVDSKKQDTSSETQEQLLACHICLKEVPASGAKSDETSDYVRHFCGLECYDKWKKKHESPES